MLILLAVLGNKLVNRRQFLPQGLLPHLLDKG